MDQIQKKKIDSFLKILKKNKVNIIDINDNYNTDYIKKWAYKFDGNINDLKKFKYKSMPLGMGAASSLISLYNNKTPNLISIMSNVRELLCTSALIYEKK